MKKRLFIISFTVIVFFMPLHIVAQIKIPLLNRLDSMLEVRQKSPKTDTNYVLRPDYRWTFRILNNVASTHFTLKLNDNDESASIRFKDPLRYTVTFSANYRGLAVALAVNPAHLFGKHTSTEFNINSYSNRYGFDFLYETNGNFEGTVIFDGVEWDKITMVKESSLTINAYYAFNSRKFSYPAAFSQSFIQKRSAGSIMLGASYHHGSVNVEPDDDESFYEEDNLRKIKMNYFSVGLGYGYNLVPNRRWLMHLSALPTVVLWRENKLIMMGHNNELHASFPELSVVVRSSIVRYFKDFFTGISLVYNYTSAGDYDYIRVRHYKWRSRFIIGKRF